MSNTIGEFVISVFVKVSHLSTAPSQDVTSLGWFIGVFVSCVFVKVSHLSTAPSQDVTSLGWFIGVFVSCAPSQDVTSLGWFMLTLCLLREHLVNISYFAGYNSLLIAVFS